MSEEDRQAAVDALHMMNEYAVKLGFPETELDFTFYLYEDIDKLLRAYQRELGLPSLRAARKKWGGVGGQGNSDFIFVHSQPHWTREILISVSAHEMVHVHQHSLSELKSAPGWLAEGVAEFLSERAMLEASVYPHNSDNYNQFRNVVFVSHSKRIDYILSLYPEYEAPRLYGNQRQYR